MFFENIENNYYDLMYNHNIPKESNKVSEGFLKGNMFNEEYVPYKNMTYLKPKINNKQEQDLLEIMCASFEINDYNLYLDTHPTNGEILTKYKNATNKLMELCKIYEKNYGPLEITKSDYPTFKWIESPWPWDNKDGKYV